MQHAAIYTYTLLVVVILSLVAIRPNYYRYAKVIDVPQPYISLFLFAFAVYIMGNVPILWGNWTSDRSNFVADFINISQGGRNSVFLQRDKLFGYYMWACGLVMNYKVWLYVTSFIYIGNYWLSARRLAGDYMYVLFLAMLCCFQYFSYGTHIIRGGLAGSFFILALTFSNKWVVMLPLLLLSFNLHASMVVPIVALLLALMVKKNKLFLWGWFLVLVASYVMPGLEKLMPSFFADRASGYLTGSAAVFYGRTGFRWDFLAYSALPIYLGYYYIYKLRFQSDFYQIVYRTYLAANAVWLIVIRVPFTDRFAYLSWFLFPILLFYPLLTKQLFFNVKLQWRAVIITLLGEFGFTFLMFIR